MKLFLVSFYAGCVAVLISGCTASGPQKSASPPPAKAKAALAAAENPEGSKKLPGKLVFDYDEEPKNSKYAGYNGGKPYAPFDHAQHVKYDGSTCVTCHHTNSMKLSAATGESSEFVMKCTNCHNDKTGEKTPSPFEGTHETLKFKGKPSPEAQIAYHGEDGAASDAGCITCHKKLQAKFEKAAKTVSCDRCHTGEKS